MNARSFDAAVVGAGPAGLAAACLLAQAGVSCALVTGGSRKVSDTRTVALMVPSMRLLVRLGIWPGRLAAECAPLKSLRLVDDTGTAFKAPDLRFRASEIGETEFGWNIPLTALVAALTERIETLPVAVYHNAVTAARPDAGRINLALDSDEAIAARVVLAADGRASLLRKAASIAVNEWSYDQAAIAASFGHSAPHHDISTEYHKPAGPFTTVPMPGARSSLVWMERPQRAASLMALCDREFATEIQLAIHGELGRVSDPGPRQMFAMRGLKATKFAARRVMLIGESGHVLPPLGAQGLNMSLRDAAHAAHLVERALASGDDPGGDAALMRYDAIRRDDIAPRQSAVDFMNRSLLAEFLPLHAMRAAGLSALERFGPLRRHVMAAGAALSADLPPAMQPQGTTPA